MTSRLKHTPNTGGPGQDRLHQLDLLRLRFVYVEEELD